MSDTPAIEIEDLRVDYGDFIAVDDLSLTVPSGEVFGLVGPNGAGKTSTFRVLATLIEPTYGGVRINGIDILEQREAAREILGYMPDLAPVPTDLRAWEFLDFYADSHALGNAAARKRRVDECLDIVNLQEKRNSWCRQLSRGQTQRLVLAKTLLHRPRVLILDEPASGLDPLSRRELRHALQALAADGATVLVSSHILSELAEMCSSLCVVNQGKILASGSAEEIRDKLGGADRTLTLTIQGDSLEAIDWLGRQSNVSDLTTLPDASIAFRFRGDDDAQANLVAEMVSSHIRLRALEEKKSSFEEILVEVAEANRTQ